MAMDLICLGEPLVEFVRQGGPGSPDYLRGFGGDTSNAAISAARQGAKVGYLTALGDDPFGQSIRELWAAEGVDASAVKRDPDAQTGVYFVDPDPAGRAFTYYRAGSAASRMRPADLPRAYLESAGCLHVSGITLAVSDNLRATALAAIDIVAAAGGAVSVDTNLRLKLWSAEDARAVTHAAMAKAAIAVTSIDDSEILTGLTDPAAIADLYQGMGPQTVLVTMGEKGCYLADGDARAQIAPARANPVDSTGAGDSFAGAFLAWRAELGDATKAAERAAIVAAGTVSGYGAVDPIPRRDAVLATLGA